MATWEKRDGEKPLSLKAREEMNPSWVVVEPGVAYRVRKIEITKPFFDKNIPVPTAKGLPSSKAPEFLSRLIWRLFEGWRRVPDAHWFELIAIIEETKETFRVTREDWFRPQGEGRLYFFVNDVRGFYGNNKGELSFILERKK